MTTIATDGYSMAGDGKVTGSFVECTSKVKVHKIKGELVGCSGNTDAVGAYIKWLKGKGPKPIIDDAEKLAALHVRKNNTAYIVQGPNGTEQPVDLPFAIGSGSHFAVGAMMAGASPKEAVEIACKFDMYSGGTIMEISLVDNKNKKEV